MSAGALDCGCAGTKARIVKIGNSRGVRIPRLLLDQANLGTEVELEVHGGELIIRPSGRPRAQWDDRFAEMSERHDDGLLDVDGGIISSWAEAEWEW